MDVLYNGSPTHENICRRKKPTGIAAGSCAVVHRYCIISAEDTGYGAGIRRYGRKTDHFGGQKRYEDHDH